MIAQFLLISIASDLKAIDRTNITHRYGILSSLDATVHSVDSLIRPVESQRVESTDRKDKNMIPVNNSK